MKNQADDKLKAKVFDNIENVKAKFPPTPKRKLGLLEGKVKVIFSNDFKMTEEDFLFQSSK